MSEPFPLPGEDFNRRKLALLRPSKTVIRINKTWFPNPLFWSRQGKYRFDSIEAPTASYTPHRMLKGQS
jgi:hypothetical protein